MQHAFVGRQFSVGLLSFYTNHEQSTGSLWSQIILSKMFVWMTDLEDIVFLWSKGKACLLPNIKDGFPKLRVPAYIGVIWPSSCYPMGIVTPRC